MSSSVAAQGSLNGVQFWLHLEKAHRSRGLRHSAETALRRGLAAHPEDPRLRVRLVELVGLCGRWAECVDFWTGLEGVDDRFITATAYERVARSLRMLNRPTAALEVAEAGERRWPRDGGTDRELHLCRAALVDWKQAIATAAPQPDEDPGEPVGLVTDLGFLIGGRAPIEGWLTSPDDEAPVVTLLVNGQPVAETAAARLPSHGGRYGFSLRCHDLLRYLGDGDTISMQRAARPLVVDGHTAPLEVRTGYESRMPVLARKIAAGHVFTKTGSLREGHTPRRMEESLSLYREVAAILSQSYGYPAFPFYGNLLGAVREHDVIAHDVGGFDMGYISRHDRPEDVRAEFVDVCRRLLDRGFRLKIEPWSAYVKPQHDSTVFVDLNYAWFNRSDELNVSYGWRFPPVTGRGRVLAPRESLIGDHLVPVPGNAEEVLEQLYGPAWAIPDQGFTLDVGLKRDLDFLLTVDEMTALASADPDRVQAMCEHHPALAFETSV